MASWWSSLVDATKRDLQEFVATVADAIPVAQPLQLVNKHQASGSDQLSVGSAHLPQESAYTRREQFLRQLLGTPTAFITDPENM